MRIGLITLLLINLAVHAQKYSMVQEGATWISLIWDHNHAPNSDGNYRSYSYLSGDTILDSTSYMKMYTSNSTDTIPQQSNLRALLREDSGRVYIIILADTTLGNYYRYWWECALQDTLREVMLYDFNLSKGDSITHIVEGKYVESRFVNDVDSILISGAYRKRMEIFGGNSHEFWIDGIGSTNGPYDPFCIHYRSGSSLKCYWNNSIFYKPYNQTDCKYVDVEEVEKPSLNFDVFPNPTSGLLQIRIDEMSPQLQVVLRNLSGQVVIKEEFYHTQNVQVELDGKSGIYLLEIWSDGKLIGKKKVIKQ